MKRIETENKLLNCNFLHLLSLPQYQVVRVAEANLGFLIPFPGSRCAFKDVGG